MRLAPFTLTLVLAGLGCASRPSSSSSSVGISGAASSSSTGATTAASSGGTTGTTSGGGATATGGSSSTGAVYKSPFFDGGYVFCALSAADAGPHGDGGKASWVCEPGTYFCDSSGDLGNCFQCRSDGDCANSHLPTYDPGRTRCDLDSGVPGYQGFCQQCLGDPDCAGNASGAVCDVDAGAAAPSIERLGFETCGQSPPAAPPVCYSDGYLLDGGCVPPFDCQADQDCAGLISMAQIAVPYCVNKACKTCQNAYCPGNICFAEQCGALPGADAGLTCNMGHYECGCTADQACGELWPVCEELDAGFANGMGQPAGLCGCDQDDQCGDAGLSCIQPPGPNGTHLLGYCGVPCGDPRLPDCVVFAGDRTPVCDAYSHFCKGCASDTECLNETSGLTGSICRPDGTCGCKVSGDCPAGQTCQPPYQTGSDQARLGFCAPPPPRCTPGSCNGDLCDPDGGCEKGVACATDYDCAIDGRYDPFCIGDAGVCRQCTDDIDCLEGQFGAELTTCNASFSCVAQCAADQDCAGNELGSLCLTANGNVCGCASDGDCAGNPAGPHCDTSSADEFFGQCLCDNDSECATGDACQAYTSLDSQCGSRCGSDADCPRGFDCDATGVCRARCDQGNTCAAPDPICDVDNIVGRNGEPANTEPKSVWCYQCLTAGDCDAGLGCLAANSYSCGPCAADSDCRPGEACASGVCHAPCDAGACAPGQVCDNLGAAGHGAGICYQCVGPMDCPDGLGCDDVTHTCGTCRGPTAKGGPFDCPPGAICSSYWTSGPNPGECLQNCDDAPCPPGQACDWFPSLTPDHRYCFGCLRDSDCADAGSGAWCDTSVDLTFSCKPPPP